LMTQPGAVGIERKQRMLLSEETVDRASSRLQTIICTSRLTEAERFHGEVLALPLKGRSTMTA